MRIIAISAVLALVCSTSALAQENPLIALLAKGSDKCQVVRQIKGDNGPKMVEVVCKTEADFNAFKDGIKGIVSYGAGKSSEGTIYQIEQSTG